MNIKTARTLLVLLAIVLLDIYVFKLVSPTVKDLFGFFVTNRHKFENVINDFSEPIEIEDGSKFGQEFPYKRCVSITGQVSDTVIINGWIKVAGEVDEEVCSDWYASSHSLTIKEAPHVNGELKIMSVYFY